MNNFNLHYNYISKLWFSEWYSGDIRILQTPSDVISHRGRTVHFNCTVEGLSHRDSLIWWKYNPSSGYQKLFVSHPSAQEDPVYLDSNKYEIRGHYNLYIHGVTHIDSGMYMCEISGHRNHTANLTVVGKYSFTSIYIFPLMLWRKEQVLSIYSFIKHYTIDIVC